LICIDSIQKEKIMLKALAALAFCLALPLCAGEQLPAKPININSASVTELMQLPKVGQKTAERIVSFRKQHGSFKRIEEIMNVKGIGEKTFAQLKPYLALGTGPAPTNP
jgi:competence protein ComEA